MLHLIDKFAKKNNIIYTTHKSPSKCKSKCLLLNGKSGNTDYPAPLLLNEEHLPWVKSAVHLGHELKREFSMGYCAWTTRTKFIDKSTSAFVISIAATSDISM